MIVVTTYVPISIDCSFIYWTNISKEPPYIKQHVVGKFTTIQNSPILDVCHIPINGKWLLDSLKIAAYRTILVLNVNVEIPEDLVMLNEFKYFQTYNTYICIRYCSPQLKHDCFTILKRYDLIYMKEAQEAYLTNKPLKHPCKCFTHIRQGIYANSYYYCDKKNDIIQPGAIYDVNECEYCKYFDGYEASYFQS